MEDVAALQYIEKLDSLPTLPVIASKVANLTSGRSETSVKEVAELIKKDVALSAKILQVINSSFYAFSREIISLSEAVSLMGFQQVGNLALGLSVVENFPQTLIYGFDYREFWERSVGNAVAAVMVATKSGSDVSNGAFTTSLLQNIGTYVLVRYLPLAFGDAAGVARERGIHTVHAEREVIGTDHAEVGALLAERWSLPKGMQTAIGHHHFSEFGPTPDPEVEQEESGPMVRVLNLANLITDVVYEPDGEEQKSTLVDRAHNLAGLTQVQIDEILDTLPREVDSVKSLFQLDRVGVEEEDDDGPLYHEQCPKCGSRHAVKFCGDYGSSLRRTTAKEAREGTDNKVLVTEDSEGIRTAILSLLRKRGYKTFIAIDGQEAVELASQEQPDLILMDIKMPGMDGIEALRVIRRDIRLQSTPVVMLTSVTDLNTVTEAIESGANDYIAKPFKIGKLMECVEKYVHAKTADPLEKKPTAE
jgi:HD-like signal output (HDOD) protein/CheY-like chemotaxis protein